MTWPTTPPPIAEHPAALRRESTFRGKATITPGSSPHRGGHKNLGMNGHPAVNTGHFRSTSCSPPCSCQARTRSGTHALPSALPRRALAQRATQLLPHSLPATLSRITPPAILSKRSPNHLTHHSPCPCPVLFLFEGVTTCHMVCSFVHCHPPYPAAMKCPLHDSRDLAHLDHNCVPST